MLCKDGDRYWSDVTQGKEFQGLLATTRGWEEARKDSTHSVRQSMALLTP